MDDFSLTKNSKNHSVFEPLSMYQKPESNAMDKVNLDDDNFEKEFDRYKRNLLDSSKIISSDFYVNDPISLMKVLKKQNESNLNLIRLLQNFKKDKKINVKTSFTDIDIEGVQGSEVGDSLLKDEINFQKEELNLENWKEEFARQESDHQNLFSDFDFTLPQHANLVPFDSQIFLKTSDQLPENFSHGQSDSKIDDIFLSN